MHQQPRGAFQPAAPYQQQVLSGQYQQPVAPPGAAPHSWPGGEPHYSQAPPQPPAGPRPKWQYILVIVIVAIVSFGAGEATGKTSTAKAATSSPAASAAPAATAQPAAKSSPATSAKAAAAPKASAPAPASRHVLARFSGSGIENTSQFTVSGSGNWELKWSYDCSSAGGSGNFIVGEDSDNDFNGANVNELGAGGHGVTHVYSDAGTHYLDVDSECNWEMTAVSEP